MKKLIKITLPIVAIGVACKVVHKEIINHRKLSIQNKLFKMIDKNIKSLSSEIVTTLIK